MLIRDVLNFILDDAMEDARMKHLQKISGPLAFEGASAAIQECRDKMSSETVSLHMRQLLIEARERSQESVSSGAPDAWFWFAREVQIESIADMISVLLIQHDMPTIVPPTRGAAVAIAKLLGMIPAD